MEDKKTRLEWMLGVVIRPMLSLYGFDKELKDAKKEIRKQKKEVALWKYKFRQSQAIGLRTCDLIEKVEEENRILLKLEKIENEED
jgi:hypothetical protein